jgi:hypothetical protein
MGRHKSFYVPESLRALTGVPSKCGSHLVLVVGLPLFFRYLVFTTPEVLKEAVAQGLRFDPAAVSCWMQKEAALGCECCVGASVDPVPAANPGSRRNSSR